MTRNIGMTDPRDDVPVPADICITFALSAGTAAAADMPSMGEICRLTGMSSAGNSLAFSVNMQSTAVIVPTAGTSQSSAGVSTPVLGQTSFQVPGVSTGFSVVSLTSGYVFAEFWNK